MTAGRVVTPKDVNSMFSHLFELAAASDSLGSQLPFAACSSSGYYADAAGLCKRSIFWLSQRRIYGDSIDIAKAVIGHH